jgi:hypothetical protein
VRNIVIDSLDLDNSLKPLAGSKVIATVTLIASTSGTAITLSGGGKDAALPSGIPVRFERVDLSQISATGKSGDSLSILGHTVD